ncbi:glycosyltransferase family 4 protein [Methanospirillum stamsii]|uniref:Glycosyltransferase family 1 protein n=1 Tax=Methanospirillum stamsii TaxID=1277351 RepID=A0A2V2N3T7_9EURY|nr:glycosyltransferase family 4 protein [Methanospirillum stamsii]PWR72386.1 glycosyltransferase family 1 protein [Methanospirillum stamsii]
MERKKIAFFCWESMYSERVGGLANAATYLAQELARYNEVHFFTRGDGDYSFNGVHYHGVRPEGGNILEYCHNMSHQMVNRFREYDKVPFDILHFHDWHVTEALHLLQKRNTVFTYHSTEFGRNGDKHGDWWEYHEICGKEWYAGLIARQVTTVSNVLRNEVMDLYKVPDWKIRVFPNGVIPEQFDVDLDQGSIKADLGIHPYAPTILYIGRMAVQKGPDLLLDALPRVKDEFWGMQVIMAGDGGMRPWLMHEAYMRNLPVRFPGYISDAEYIRLLKAADLVVIPSRNEPFGIVLPEAWSAGKPVVACDVGGLHENIESYRDGIKVPVDSNQIAEGICQALRDTDRLSKFGRTGRSKVYRQFKWEGIAHRLDDMYGTVCC